VLGVAFACLPCCKTLLVAAWRRVQAANRLGFADLHALLAKAARTGPHRTVDRAADKPAGGPPSRLAVASTVAAAASLFRRGVKGGAYSRVGVHT
jgi:hypothetical protein